uniref:Major facilitator superfamily (MFS) profile domain-containing protein n=1 Tax=Bionectria ochroleuca TaxID=29856 RepID=A0A8H7N127_BIOOC
MVWYLYAHCRRHLAPRPLRPEVLPRFRREHHPDWVHVHCLGLLHPVGAVSPPELVVLLHRPVHHHWRRAQLRLRTNQRGGLHSWQYIYLMAGAVTFLFGLLCFIIPNSPVSAWFLTKEEKFAAVERLRYGQTGVRCTTFKKSQLKEAILDIKIWLVALMMASAYTVNGAVSGFGPLIVSTFGWSTLDSILFQFPLGGLCFIVILLTGYLGSKFSNIRIFMLVFTCLPVIAGCAIIWKSEWSYHAAAPVVGYSITGFFGGTVSLIITIGMSNVAGHTKKSFMAATIFVAYCVGNIVGPQLIWSETKKDHYPALWTGLIICYVICILASLALYAVLRNENKKRDRIPIDETERAKLAFQDLTDKENPYFRYVY